MQVKLVGIGKCGIRVAYDLFAYTTGLPSAYEIRLDSTSNSDTGVLATIGLRREAIRQRIAPFKAALNDLLRELNGLYRIAETPQYVTIDSDSANNEIVNKVTLITRDDDNGNVTKAHRFPGQNFDLNDHQGGCNFHIVSEYLARSWKNVPVDIVDSEGVSIFVASFSIAGGTGGGSAAIICSKSRTKRSTKGPCHYMGLGVLPKSDEQYWESDVALTMADYEKFNAGRFFVSLYGKRVPMGMNSVWLFSNDILRFLIDEKQNKDVYGGVGGEMKLNLSLVNFYIAQSLTVLANSSSSLTSAETNLDPKELNDYLNDKPFVSALARLGAEEGSADLEQKVMSVKRLLLRALSNVEIREGRLEGLSVPVPEDDLGGVRHLLDDTVVDYKSFMKEIDGYSSEDGPIEFQTAYRLVILYGQPEKKASETKKDMISKACECIFPNAQKLHFYFRHHANSETLLLFLVDPFIRPVVSAMYYYANNAWSEKGKSLQGELDEVIGASEYVKAKVEKLLEGEELIPESIYGGGVEDAKKRLTDDGEVAVRKEQVCGAFAHLYEVYHRERPTMKTSSKLGKRGRADRKVEMERGPTPRRQGGSQSNKASKKTGRK